MLFIIYVSFVFYYKQFRVKAIYLNQCNINSYQLCFYVLRIILSYKAIFFELPEINKKILIIDNKTFNEAKIVYTNILKYISNIYNISQQQNCYRVSGLELLLVKQYLKYHWSGIDQAKAAELIRFEKHSFKVAKVLPVRALARNTGLS